MRIPNEARSCAFFIGIERYNSDGTVEKIVRATAFWVLVPIGKDAAITYIVTAKHNLTKIRGLGIRKVQLQFNFEILTSFWEEVDIDEWIFHPDDNVDVAILPFAWRRYGPAGHIGYTLDALGDDDYAENPRIGVGDEVFITGLFYRHHGKKRAIPIVRIGNIAAMPEEPVETDIGEIDAYLIEARSIGGLSGSPVFANLSNNRNTPKFYLIGLVHGHFDETLVEEAIEDDYQREARINMGIAIVVPASKIREAIYNTPQSVAYIKRATQELT